MLNKRLNVQVDGGYSIPLPDMYKVRQVFKKDRLESIPNTVKEEIAKENIKSSVKAGDRVAVAVGSRGIANLFEIVEAVINELKKLGAEPFIFPAMGSH